MLQKNIRFIDLSSSEYPDRLRHIINPPRGIFAIGNMSLLNHERSVAVIGSRRPTPEGERTTGRIVRALCQAHYVIVSGLAFGIDSLAHTECLRLNGRTIAVLPGEVGQAYPRSHQQLYEQIIAKGGLVISEYPAGVSPQKYMFLARNRLISGLAKGCVVIEGTQTSGTLTTASHAGHQGRDLFVVPGSIYSDLSAAPNTLLKQGGIPVTHPKDIVDYYQPQYEVSTAVMPLFGFPLHQPDVGFSDNDVSTDGSSPGAIQATDAPAPNDLSQHILTQITSRPLSFEDLYIALHQDNYDHKTPSLTSLLNALTELEIAQTIARKNGKYEIIIE